MKWIDRGYGFYQLQLPGGFSGMVGWDSTISKDAPDELRGFKVSFENTVLKKRYKNLEEAKAACILLAKSKLEEALKAVLDSLEKS